MSVHLRIITLTVLLLLAMLSSSSTHGEQHPLYKIESFRENFSEQVKVSGSLLASYLHAGKQQYASPDSLNVYLVAGRNNLVIKLVSIDGKYAAEAKLTHSSAKNGWEQVRIPSKFSNVLTSYSRNELVPYVFASGNDEFGNYVEEVFPASWGTPDGNAGHLLINSDGFYPSYSYKDTEDKLINLPCNKINNKLTRAYNYSCPFETIKNGSSTVLVITPEPGSSGYKYIVWSL